MTEMPDELMDDEGKWIKRQVLVDEMVDENDFGEQAEQKVDRILQEMIDEGPMREKEVDDVPYVQLESRLDGLMAYMRYRGSMAKNRIGSMIRGDQEHKTS